MLTSIIAPRSRPLRVNITLNSRFALYDTSAQRTLHRIQTRAFRFGLWSSFLENAYHHELRRRCQSLKHDYADAINKKLSWHDNLLSEEPNPFGKRTVTRYRSRWIYPDEPGSQRVGSYHCSFTTFSFETEPKQPSSRSPTKNSSDFRGRQGRSDMKSECGTERRSDQSHSYGTSDMTTSPRPIETENSTAEQEEYVIDPISNRKVPKREGGAPTIHLDPPVPTAATDRPQFESYSPSNLDQESPLVNSNDQLPVSELGKSVENHFDDLPAVGADASSEPADFLANSENSSSESDNSTSKKDENALNPRSQEYPLYGCGRPDNCEAHDGAVGEASGNSKNHDTVDKLDPSGQTLETSQLQSELEKYGPYLFNRESPDNMASEKPHDLENYRYSTPGITEASAEIPTPYDDLHKYEPTIFDEIKDDDHSPKKYEDLEKYKDFRHQDPNSAAALERDVVAESLKEYDGKEEYHGTPDFVNDVDNVPEAISTINLPEGHAASRRYSAGGEDVTANPTDGVATTRQKLQRRMDELSEQYDAMDREIKSGLYKTLQSLKHDQTEESPQLLNGNSLQASSEGFEKTQYAHEGGSGATRNRAGIVDVSSSEEAQGPNQNAGSNAFLHQTSNRPQNSSRLESALDRFASAPKGHGLNRVYGADLYSKEPQGLETSFIEECGGRHTMPLYTRTYANVPGQTAATSKSQDDEIREPAESSSHLYYHRDPEVDGIPKLDSTELSRDRGASQPEKPTLYKILAYDPATRRISIAETTSIVQDTAHPLSPTEVLPRLSNPAKFFPYFASLEDEGFEIVTGHGDVLVFRQIRPGKPSARGGVTVNPIDMMGRPAAVPSAAAFVSPTGFVNYDVLDVDAQSAEPPFRSNLHVRREEPVFSGQKSSSDSAQSKKPRMKKTKRVIIGGASVVGMSYAVGVVREYFTTGGADGKGPSGFSPT